MKKPRLTIVPSQSTGEQPPRKLGPSGLSLWRSITTEYTFDDAGSLEMLMQTCAAADRLDKITAQIAREGLTIRGKNGLREHPLLKTELSFRSFVTRNLARLGIGIEPVRSIGRPGSACGVSWQQLRDRGMDGDDDD